MKMSMMVTMTVALNCEHADTRWFYVWMAGVCALIFFSGFGFTYLAPVASRSFDGAPILHLHGLLFFSWTLLFLVETTLVAAFLGDLLIVAAMACDSGLRLAHTWPTASRLCHRWCCNPGGAGVARSGEQDGMVERSHHWVDVSDGLIGDDGRGYRSSVRFVSHLRLSEVRIAWIPSIDNTICLRSSCRLRQRVIDVADGLGVVLAPRRFDGGVKADGADEPPAAIAGYCGVISLEMP